MFTDEFPKLNCDFFAKQTLFMSFLRRRNRVFACWWNWALRRKAVLWSQKTCSRYCFERLYILAGFGSICCNDNVILGMMCANGQLAYIIATEKPEILEQKKTITVDKISYKFQPGDKRKSWQHSLSVDDNCVESTKVDYNVRLKEKTIPVQL